MTLAASPTLVHSPASPGLLDNESQYEIINGQRMELPPASILAMRVASRLMGKLGLFLNENPLGEVTKGLFHLPLPVDRCRRPDVAFVSAQRIAQKPAQPGSDSAWDIVPELMVEVISPSDVAEDIMDRLAEYWAAGTQLIWVVYPTHRLVYVYDAPRQVRLLTAADDLEGGSVLPGLRIPIASLFPAGLRRV
jgi:Uma2 family endonuclease